ncbi:DUF2461 domain-containing protein [Gallaecimonas sp. GXIMD4217]|uniref:DUF2461 domain-containing protein n=1 Tax=Gallaecimonas sp. GXIMD4217 TaxID=3131927 RepID=UPI00311B3E98
MFSQDSLDFLAALAANNDRDWFQDHKQDYERRVKAPALAFIDAMAAPMAEIAPRFAVGPRCLMRVYRDTRFARDKRPYKTNVGIQFRHDLGKDVHAPGYYVHVEPGQCFLGVGSWHPESQALRRIRDCIDDSPRNWLLARDDKAFRSHFQLRGESLVRPPKGFAADHPHLEDLKRKDYIAVCPIDDDAVLGEGFVAYCAERFRSADRWMRFLCHAMEAPFEK